MTRKILFAAGLALAAAAPASAVNILVNPGFESGALAPWYQKADFGGPENWNATTADFHTGKWSATDVGNKLIAQDFAPVAVADVLEASLWIKNVDGSVNALYVAYSDNTSEEFLQVPPANQWVKFDMTADLDPGKFLVSIGVYGVNGGGPIDRTYVDDGVVDVIPAPGAAARLGLGGLLAARRRRTA